MIHFKRSVNVPCERGWDVSRVETRASRQDSQDGINVQRQCYYYYYSPPGHTFRVSCRCSYSRDSNANSQFFGGPLH